jgi:hypothetical protein
MGIAVLAVLILGKNTENWNTTPTALAEWTIGFYLMSLFLETIFLARLLSHGEKQTSIEGK